MAWCIIGVSWASTEYTSVRCLSEIRNMNFWVSTAWRPKASSSSTKNDFPFPTSLPLQPPPPDPPPPVAPVLPPSPPPASKSYCDALKQPQNHGSPSLSCEALKQSLNLRSTLLHCHGLKQPQNPNFYHPPSRDAPIRSHNPDSPPPLSDGDIERLHGAYPNQVPITSALIDEGSRPWKKFNGLQAPWPSPFPW